MSFLDRIDAALNAIKALFLLGAFILAAYVIYTITLSGIDNKRSNNAVIRSMPDDQKSFLRTINAARAVFTTSSGNPINDNIARDAARLNRAADICNILRARRVENWTGRVVELGSVEVSRGIPFDSRIAQMTGGLAYIVINISGELPASQSVVLQSNKNLMSEVLSNEFVSGQSLTDSSWARMSFVWLNSEVGSAVRGLSVGSSVSFSGEFFPFYSLSGQRATGNCVMESPSSDVNRSMTNPEFLFRITALRPL